MHGLHLTADLRGCPAERAVMTQPAALRECCLGAVRDAGLLPVGELFHRFEAAVDAAPAAPQGVTGVVLLAESHLAVHTWPERGEVTIDVYVCNHGRDNSRRAHALLGQLLDAFAPARVERHTLLRGATEQPT
jgi:S-adenosylmethionine decarboxylase